MIDWLAGAGFGCPDFKMDGKISMRQTDYWFSEATMTFKIVTR